MATCHHLSGATWLASCHWRRHPSHRRTTGQRWRSTVANDGQRWPTTVNGGGQRWPTTVNGGRPPLTTAGSVVWPGQRPGRVGSTVATWHHVAADVAEGINPHAWIEHETSETFSPVADIRAIRILISIAAFYDYEIWQMDVKTAFLNGYLDEDIYMVQPEGFVDPKHPRKVCKLQRSIYGLKQASRSWNKRFDEEIKKFGFDQNLDEPCVYQKASGSNIWGKQHLFLGIKIYRDRSKRLIGLGQNAYMDKILKRYRMDNSKRGHIPMQERLDLNKTQGASTPEEVKRMQNVPYDSAVGSIINTKDMFLVYGGNSEAELRVDCYCDAGFETDRDETKSQT
ncbi:retrotransposon protein, putative, ty1-copia subclass [Tanacetum coccineum]